jgi:UDP-N-acetylglucosamine diphosphorylase/glucosamine-1-phosphate N-acetyltransferase
MRRRIAFFEDRAATGFGALALTRPVFELVCGHFSLRERLIRTWNVDEWGVFLRSYLEETYQEQHPEAFVNDLNWLSADTTVLINGRWLPDPQALDEFDTDGIGYCGETAVYITLSGDEALNLFDGSWETLISQTRNMKRAIPTGGRVFRYPWDLVEANADQIRHDFALRRYGNQLPKPHPQVVCLGPADQIQISWSAEVDPFVVIDARKGPVSVEDGAALQPFTRLEGPCHIGRSAQLFRANIKGGTTIGPVCRVGGEIETSIMIGYSNKYHDGYLGHSYVGSWCNLGANTVGSDLKLDYSAVRVPLNGISIDSGYKKVGYYIGDFSKTGIGTLFNTGTSVGIMCLVLPSGDYAPRFIPSFCEARGEVLSQGLPFAKWLDVVQATLERRNTQMTAAQERLYRFLQQSTKGDRDQAFLRFQTLKKEITEASQPLAW